MCGPFRGNSDLHRLAQPPRRTHTGPETGHREGIRAGLIRNLNDPAARGNQRAIDALIAQLRRDPPLGGPLPGYAQQALGRIATKKGFVRIAALLDELPDDPGKGWLIEYLGKVKTPDARAITLRYLHTTSKMFAIKALIQMKAAGVRHLIEPHANNANAAVRKYAKRALERLSE